MTLHIVTGRVRDAVHVHTTTGPDGKYSFRVPPGHYTACETAPDGYTQSYPTAATAGSTDCATPHAGRGWDVTLTSGSTDAGNDFGNFRNATYHRPNDTADTLDYAFLEAVTRATAATALHLAELEP